MPSRNSKFPGSIQEAIDSLGRAAEKGDRMAKDHLEEIENFIENIFSEHSDDIHKVKDNLKKHASEMKDQGEAFFEEAEGWVKSQFKKHPTRTIIGLGLLGFIAGVLLTRSRD